MQNNDNNNNANEFGILSASATAKPIALDRSRSKSGGLFQDSLQWRDHLDGKKKHQILYFSPNQSINRSIHASPQSIMNALASGCCDTARCSENKSYWRTINGNQPRARSTNWRKEWNWRGGNKSKKNKIKSHGGGGGGCCVEVCIIIFFAGWLLRKV